MLPWLINKDQNAFVGGKQILYASLIANKGTNSMLQKKEKGVLCKLDIEKAYNHLNWNCPFGVMQNMGFGWKWVRWCISTFSFLVLINDRRGFLIAQEPKTGRTLSPPTCLLL